MKKYFECHFEYSKQIYDARCASFIWYILYDTEWSEILSMVTIIAKSFQGERFVSNHQYVKNNYAYLHLSAGGIRENSHLSFYFGVARCKLRWRKSLDLWDSVDSVTRILCLIYIPRELRASWWKPYMLYCCTIIFRLEYISLSANCRHTQIYHRPAALKKKTIVGMEKDIY